MFSTVSQGGLSRGITEARWIVCLCENVMVSVVVGGRLRLNIDKTAELSLPKYDRPLIT